MFWMLDCLTHYQAWSMGYGSLLQRGRPMQRKQPDIEDLRLEAKSSVVAGSKTIVS
jgi:hypothetical protein